MDRQRAAPPSKAEADAPHDPEGLEDGDAAATPGRVKVGGGQTCPLCRDPLTTLPRLEVCPDCKAVQHWSCVVELGSCGTMGCGGLDGIAQAPEEASRQLALVSHLGNVLGGGLWLPLIVYLLARSRGDAFARHHAQQGILAFGATMASCGLLTPVFVVLSVVAGMKAYRGEWYGFPVLRRLASPEAQAAARLEEEPDTGEAKPDPEPGGGVGRR